MKQAIPSFSMHFGQSYLSSISGAELLLMFRNDLVLCGFPLSLEKKVPDSFQSCSVKWAVKFCWRSTCW